MEISTTRLPLSYEGATPMDSMNGLFSCMLFSRLSVAFGRLPPADSDGDLVQKQNGMSSFGRLLTYGILLIVAYELIGLSSIYSPAEMTRLQQPEAWLTFRSIRRQFEQSINLAQDVVVKGDKPGNYASKKLEQLQSEARSTLDIAERIFPASSMSLRPNMEEIFTSIATLSKLSDSERASAATAIWDKCIIPARDGVQSVIFKLLETLLMNNGRLFSEKLSDSRRHLQIIFWGLILACVNQFAWNHKRNRMVRRQEHKEAREILELARAQEDLKHLSARLLTVQEDERKHLSRELHDSLGQLLTAIRMEIIAAESSSPALSKEECELRIHRAHLYLAEAIKTVRNITAHLRPPILDDIGLDAALRWHAEQFSQRTGITCTLTPQDFHTSLPESWNTCVYRIMQEALHNCEKHARATRVRISVVHQPGMLSVDIEDNGMGFSQKSSSSGASSGLGLLGMRERAMMLGGTLTIDSSLGRGTKVQLRLPTAEMSASKSDEHGESSTATV